MSLILAIRVNTPSADFTVFGAIAIFRGSQLADAICHLRGMAREGLRDKRLVDAEVELLIDNSKLEGK